jgi:hypothetical protein
VILLENSNEWNLSPAKRRILRKKEEKGARIERKRGETSFEKLHVSNGEKKKRMRFISCWERLY